METSAPAAPQPPAQRPGSDRPTAAEIVTGILAGSAAAEGELVRVFGPPVRLLLTRHTRSPEEAEDLYQDTFGLALEKLRRGELREADKLPAFLSGLARNLTIETYRKAGRRKTEPDSDAIDRTESHHSDPLSETLAAEHATLVRRVLGELRNDRDRQVLYRFYLVEEDRQAIADDLDLTLLQFNRVLHRARLRFKELAEQVWGPGTWSAVAMVAWLLPQGLVGALVIAGLGLALALAGLAGLAGPGLAGPSLASPSLASPSLASPSLADQPGTRGHELPGARSAQLRSADRAAMPAMNTRLVPLEVWEP